MDETPRTGTDATAITGIAVAVCYVDDFDAAYRFYHELLGLQKQYDLGPKACYFSLSLSEQGLYLEGGYAPAPVTARTARASFLLQTESAGALFAKLRGAGVECVQDAPVDMSGGQFWFQFFDPAGNLLEVLGNA